MTIRTAPGVNGEPIILGAWCATCRQESMPLRDGTCGWCDRQIIDPDIPPKPPSGRKTARHSRRPIPHADIVVALQSKAVELGRAPSSDEWMRFGHRPHVRTIFRRFGSWDAALTAAGLGREAA